MVALRRKCSWKKREVEWTRTRHTNSKRLEGAAGALYLQGLHGQVGGVVVMDFPGVPGGFFMQVMCCLEINRVRASHRVLDVHTDR